ncbi:hypothetical protein MKL09_15485 [Methylobacterium sp. J-048]|nr:hypothetical protein [Methylobacterium sp. J-048]MCJ2057956.1 hypothetical protein [Methylobacterium sp. J-048]
MTARFLVGVALGLTLSTAALAQSYTAPAGIPAATAPGGLEGRAAVPNRLAEGDRTGRAGTFYGTTDDLVTGSVHRPYQSRGGNLR